MSKKMIHRLILNSIFLLLLCCLPLTLFFKGRVLENSLLSPREAAEELAPLTRSEIVQVIGTKFVLYRPSHKKDKKDKIVLVSDRRK